MLSVSHLARGTIEPAPQPHAELKRRRETETETEREVANKGLVATNKTERGTAKEIMTCKIEL